MPGKRAAALASNQCPWTELGTLKLKNKININVPSRISIQFWHPRLQKSCIYLKGIPVTVTMTLWAIQKIPTYKRLWHLCQSKYPKNIGWKSLRFRRRSSSAKYRYQCTNSNMTPVPIKASKENGVEVLWKAKLLSRHQSLAQLVRKLLLMEQLWHNWTRYQKHRWCQKPTV